MLFTLRIIYVIITSTKSRRRRTTGRTETVSVLLLSVLEVLWGSFPLRRERSALCCLCRHFFCRFCSSFLILSYVNVFDRCRFCRFLSMLFLFCQLLTIFVDLRVSVISCCYLFICMNHLVHSQIIRIRYFGQGLSCFVRFVHGFLPVWENSQPKLRIPFGIYLVRYIWALYLYHIVVTFRVSGNSLDHVDPRRLAINFVYIGLRFLFIDRSVGTAGQLSWLILIALERTLPPLWGKIFCQFFFSGLTLRGWLFSARQIWRRT